MQKQNTISSDFWLYIDNALCYDGNVNFTHK